MIVKFPNSPRFYVKKNPRGLWEIIDSLNGRYEIASNNEKQMREYCHGFNYPTEAQLIASRRAYDSFADECAHYGAD